jgi:hypothetical protein
MSEEQEYEASLRRAFVDRRADFIIIDDRRQRFLIDGAAYGERMGWLKFEAYDIDTQSTQWHYRLTPKGRKHFGLEAV